MCIKDFSPVQIADPSKGVCDKPRFAFCCSTVGAAAFNKQKTAEGSIRRVMTSVSGDHVLHTSEEISPQQQEDT